jgi:hypothetical protein
MTVAKPENTTYKHKHAQLGCCCRQHGGSACGKQKHPCPCLAASIPSKGDHNYNAQASVTFDSAKRRTLTATAACTQAYM